MNRNPLQNSKIINEIVEEIYNISKDNNAPIAIQSNLFPLISKNVIKNNKEIKILLIKILKKLEKKTILMPTFIDNFEKKKIIDLDKVKSSTGILNEEFRKHKLSFRTISPTQPWSVIGKDKKMLTKLKPKLEWGKNSILEWLQKKNAQIIMLGVNPVNCILIHRVELLNKKYVHYRKIKQFKNTIIHNKKKFMFEQNYFDKILNPPNYGHLLKNKIFKNLKTKKISNFIISGYRSKDYIKFIDKYIKNYNKLI